MTVITAKRAPRKYLKIASYVSDVFTHSFSVSLIANVSLRNIFLNFQSLPLTLWNHSINLMTHKLLIKKTKWGYFFRSVRHSFRVFCSDPFSFLGLVFFLSMYLSFLGFFFWREGGCGERGGLLFVCFLGFHIFCSYFWCFILYISF